MESFRTGVKLEILSSNPDLMQLRKNSQKLIKQKRKDLDLKSSDRSKSLKTVKRLKLPYLKKKKLERNRKFVKLMHWLIELLKKKLNRS